MNGTRVLVGAVMLAALVGCGVPTGAPAEVIPPSEVPPILSAPATTSAPVAPPEPVTDPGRVYLVGGDDALVPRTRAITGASPEERLEHLLDDLADAPTSVERDEQLSTALPPDVALSVADVARGTATIDISDATQAPSGWASRLAVAQLVLTATSVPGVDGVRLTLDGQAVEAPLPSGALTSGVLTAAHYVALLPTGVAPPS